MTPLLNHIFKSNNILVSKAIIEYNEARVIYFCINFQSLSGISIETFQYVLTSIKLTLDQWNELLIRFIFNTKFFILLLQYRYVDEHGFLTCYPTSTKYVMSPQVNNIIRNVDFYHLWKHILTQ
jgi:hypothetical protein